MAEMDKRFQQILSWQQMDQNKAISQILQEVSPCLGLTATSCRTPGVALCSLTLEKHPLLSLPGTTSYPE